MALLLYKNVQAKSCNEVQCHTRGGGGLECVLEIKEKRIMGKEKKKAYNTCCSQAVTHPSTGQARRCLTSVIGRELVYSAWYGRRQQNEVKKAF